ncbi:unnamed protein product [Brachionus calyciflorus]|uniref:Uncharacterized protein n=1 Tax=Brachionus calyciflorus TaxID=104777 RepID=A0A814EM36_9BILA|nr:unnamed protein product [Brachionus calyciflorus]
MESDDDLIDFKETFRDFKLSNYNQIYKYKTSYTRRVTKIDELVNGRVVKSALNSSIRIGSTDFHDLQRLASNNIYDNFKLSQEKKFLIIYNSFNLKIFETSHYELISSINLLHNLNDCLLIDHEWLIYLQEKDLYIQSFTNLSSLTNVVTIFHNFHHGSRALCLCLVDKENFISGSTDCNIKLWNLKTLTCLKVFNRHEGSVTCLHLFKQDRFLSGSLDRTIKLWDLTTGECLRTFCGHESLITVIQVTRTNEILSLSNDGEIRQWDNDNGKCVDRLRDEESIFTYFKVLNSGKMVTGSFDGKLRKWFYKEKKTSFFKNLISSKF